MTFGEKLKQLRTERYYTQSDLAEVCDTKLFTVSRWETGSNIPRYKAIVKLAKAFDMKPSDFLEEDFSEKEKQEIQHAQQYYERTKNETHNHTNHNYNDGLSENDLFLMEYEKKTNQMRSEYLAFEKRTTEKRILDAKAEAHRIKMGFPKYKPVQSEEEKARLTMEISVGSQVRELSLEGLCAVSKFIDKLLVTNEKYKKAT